MNAIATIPRARAFDPAIAEAVCEAVANNQSVDDVCFEHGISRSSVTRWLQNVDTFATAHTQAKEQALDLIAEEIIPLSDTAQGMDAAGVQAVKLRADNRKWMLSKLRAQVYGDKLDVTSKGEALAAPSHQVDARVQSIVMQAAMRMQGALDPEALSLLD